MGIMQSVCCPGHSDTSHMLYVAQPPKHPTSHSPGRAVIYYFPNRLPLFSVYTQASAWGISGPLRKAFTVGLRGLQN